MKQIWPNYSYSPSTNVLTLTGLNIDRDQLLLVTAADRGRIMYNFADSSVTASAFTSGANTALTLVATTAGLTTTAALVIYYDDQVASNSVTGTVELGPTSLNALESITVTMGQVTVTGGLTDTQLRASAVTIGGTVTASISGTVPVSLASTTVTISSLPALAAGTAQIGSVTASLAYSQTATTIASTAVTAVPVVFPTSGAWGGSLQGYNGTNTYIYSGIQAIGSTSLASATSLPVSLSSLPALSAGTSQIGSVTVGNSVTIGSLPALAAGTNQIGSVTASISGTVPISISSVTVGNSVTIGSLPALAAGTAQIGSVTASISGTVPISISSVTVGNSVTIGSLPAISGTVTANIAISSTAITSGSFSSLTSATLVPANTARKMATVYNLGAGQLFINAGASSTTLGGGFMVALSSGDFYECDYTTTTLSAIFATAGTASWVSH